MTSTIKLGERELTRIGLGTNRLTNTPENQDFIRQAIDAGINFIDTAHLYAGGESEQTIGDALGGDAETRCLLATKGGYRSGTPETLRSEIEESLTRLRSERLGLYYLHRVDTEVPIEKSIGAIKEYQDRGTIQHIGISAVSVEEIERARSVAEIVAVQNHYNLAERGSDDVLDYCAEQGILFVPYFPLRDDGGRPIDEIARKHGVSTSQVVLAWLLKRGRTVLPIPGTLSLDHVRENLGALELELSDEEYQRLS